MTSKGDKAHNQENPKCCPGVNGREEHPQVVYALHDFFPAQAYLTFNNTWFQQRIRRCSDGNTNLVRQGQEVIIKNDGSIC